MRTTQKGERDLFQCLIVQLSRYFDLINHNIHLQITNASSLPSSMGYPAFRRSQARPTPVVILRRRIRLFQG